MRYKKGHEKVLVVLPDARYQVRAKEKNKMTRKIVIGREQFPGLLLIVE